MTSLAQLVLPSDCTSSGTCFGGTIMKLVDNAGGIVATRHCRTNVVTASIDTMDFLFPSQVGDLLHINAVPTFASSRSLEIIVRVEAEKLMTGVRNLCCHARLTFVSLGDDARPQPVPALCPTNDIESRRFTAARERYEKRKLERQRQRLHS